MKSIVTTKKKLELKKTAIANLSMSEAQMRMVVGGAGQGGAKAGDSNGIFDGDTNCTGHLETAKRCPNDNLQTL